MSWTRTVHEPQCGQGAVLQTAVGWAGEGFTGRSGQGRGAGWGNPAPCRAPRRKGHSLVRFTLSSGRACSRLSLSLWPPRWTPGGHTFISSPVCPCTGTGCEFMFHSGLVKSSAGAYGFDPGPAGGPSSWAAGSGPHTEDTRCEKLRE